jgi:nucleotide-binding universal stress UspA family protein
LSGKRKDDPETQVAKTFLEHKRILVPIDGSVNSTRAAETAVRLAKDYSAQLIFLNIIPAPKLTFGAGSVLGTPTLALDKYYEYAEGQARSLVDKMIELAKDNSVNATGEIVKSSESTVQSIIDQEKDQKVDLIVIGTRGLGSFKKMIIGSVSSGVVTYSQCPVLVVR